MKKVFKTIVATGLILATTTMSVFASNTSTGTAFTVKDDLDYITDARYFKEANVGEMFLNTNLGRSFNVAFAKQFSKFYLGTNIRGNFWGNKNENNKTSNGGVSGYFNVLIGLDNMGIGLNIGYGPSWEETSALKTNNNSFTIGAKWGSSFAMSKFDLNPYVSFDYSYEGSKSDPKTGYKNTNTYSPFLGVDFVFGKNSNFESILGITNDLSIYDTTEYDINDEKTGSKMNPDDYFKIYYKVNCKVNDKVELGGKILISNNFDSYSYADGNGDVYEKTFNYYFNEWLDLGAKFNIVPSAFTLLAGTEISLPGANVKTTTTGVGTAAENKKSTSGIYCNFGASLYTGFVWNITDNLKFDTSMTLPVFGSHSSTKIATNELFDSISVGLTYRK